jgi:hypothetical protein
MGGHRIKIKEDESIVYVSNTKACSAVNVMLQGNRSLAKDVCGVICQRWLSFHQQLDSLLSPWCLEIH